MGDVAVSGLPTSPDIPRDTTRSDRGAPGSAGQGGEEPATSRRLSLSVPDHSWINTDLPSTSALPGLDCVLLTAVLMYPHLSFDQCAAVMSHAGT